MLDSNIYGGIKMRSIGFALFLTLFFTIKTIYDNIKFSILKKRCKILIGKIAEEICTRERKKQWKIEFICDNTVNYIMVDKFDAVIGDDFKFFYNTKTGQSFAYDSINIGRKNNLIMALISFFFAILLTVFSVLMTTLIESGNTLLETIAFYITIAYTAFGIWFLIKNRKPDINNIEDDEIRAEEELNDGDFDESNMPEGFWRCMGCGRYNSDITKRCSCGYKKPKDV